MVAFLPGATALQVYDSLAGFNRAGTATSPTFLRNEKKNNKTK